MKTLEIPTWYAYDEFGEKSIQITIVENSGIAIGNEVHSIEYWDNYFIYNLGNEELRDKTLVRLNYCIYNSVRAFLISSIYAMQPSYKYLLDYALAGIEIPEEKRAKKVSYWKRFIVWVKWRIFKR